MGPFEQIEKFYREVVHLPIPDQPTRLTPEQKASAVEHWREETKEFEDAETLEDEIDAAIDLAWLALGRVIEMGAHLPEHFAEVVRANMDRVPGRNPKRPLSTGFDAVKPEGWVGPDHSAVLRRHWTMYPRSRSEAQRVAEFLDWLASDKPLGMAFCLELGDGLGRRQLVVEHPKLLRGALDSLSGAARLEAETTDAGKADAVDAEFTEVKPNGAPRIILVGHGRHGKDTVAEMLRNRYGYKFSSSSLTCAPVVLEAFRRAGFGHLYESELDCFADRHGSSEAGDHRTFWFEAIKAYCTPDKSKLAQLIFAENDLYVGIRDRRELWAAQLLPNVVTVWVDASDRLPPEQGSSMNIEPWMADLVLDNNGDLADLERNVVALMNEVHA